MTPELKDFVVGPAYKDYLPTGSVIVLCHLVSGIALQGTQTVCEDCDYRFKCVTGSLSDLAKEIMTDRFRSRLRMLQRDTEESGSYSGEKYK